MLSLLIFVGEAVRDAFDPRKTFLVDDLPPLRRDLSVAFRESGRDTLAVDRISFDILPGETVALVGERLGQVGVGALGPEVRPTRRRTTRREASCSRARI